MSSSSSSKSKSPTSAGPTSTSNIGPIGSSSSRPDRRPAPNQRASLPRQRPTPLSSSQLPAPKPRRQDKSILQSYRSLSPNARIVFGLVVGAVGIAGLMWDRQVAKDDPVGPSNTFNITTVERDTK